MPKNSSHRQEKAAEPEVIDKLITINSIAEECLKDANNNWEKADEAYHKRVDDDPELWKILCSTL